MKELTLVVMILSLAFAIQRFVYFDDIGISFVPSELIVCTIEAQYQSFGLLGFASIWLFLIRGHLSLFGLGLIETCLEEREIENFDFK